MRVNPFQTLLIALALTVIGLALVPELTLKYPPTERKPALTVQAYWRSASPEAVEREITSPREAALSLVGGINKIRSVSREGSCTIYLDLEQGGDLDLLRFEVATRVRQVAARQPAGATYPTLALSTGDDDDEEQPVLVYSLSGSLSPSELYTYARDEILPQLALTPELQRIDLAGGNAREWVLITRPELLRTYALTDQDLTQAIDRMSSQEELGFAVYNNRPYPLRLYAPDTLTPDHLIALPLATPAGQVIHLSDVAHLQVSEQIPQSYYRINGQNSLRLLCYPTVTANTITLAHLLKYQVGRIESTLPAGFHFYLDQDASEHLEAELNKIGWRSLLSLGILILFTLIAYRGWSYLVVLLSSLVVNLGLASMAYYYFGIELNLYALAGITVTFGMIMDNTIVMMHHLLKQGNRQVFPALIASTLTTISALIVVFFLPDVWKARLAEFAKVIMINLSISLLVSWWLVPAMLVKLGVRDKRDGKAMVTRTSWRLTSKRLYTRLLSSLIRWRGIAMVAAILAFGLPVFLLPNQIKGWDWYNNTLGNDWYVEHAKPVVNRVLGGTLRLFVWYVYEGSGYRTEGETMLHANARMPEGATVEQMNAAIQQIEQYLAQFPVEIRKFVSQVSSGQSGRITIRFYPEHQYSFPYLLKGRLTAYCTNLGGMDWSIYGVGQGFSTGNGGQPPRFRVVMKGYNQDELARWAQVFADSLLVHPRIQEVNTEGNIDWWARSL